MTSTDCTSSPSSQTARTKRSTSTRVLPVPAPAETKTSPVASTAFSCCSFTPVLRGTSSRGRTTRAREGTVDAAERLDADEVAQHEHVERNLQPLLGVDLARRVRALPRLVVLHDAARAERVDVDTVDLPADEETVPELEAALQLGRGAVAAEGDLEPP